MNTNELLFKCDAATLVAEDFYNNHHIISDKIIDKTRNGSLIIMLKPENVLDYVCRKLGVINVLPNKSRSGRFSRCKSIAAVVISLQYKELSLTEIGKFFGVKHDTILHYKKELSNDKRIYNPMLNTDWNKIVDSLNIKRDYHYSPKKPMTNIMSINENTREARLFRDISHLTDELGLEKQHVYKCISPKTPNVSTGGYTFKLI